MMTPSTPYAGAFGVARSLFAAFIPVLLCAQSLHADARFTNTQFEGSGAGNHLIEVYDNAGPDREVRILSVAGGTAVPGVDYEPVDTTVFWGFVTDNDGPFTRFVRILDNPARTGDRTVHLELQNSFGAIIGTPSTATFVIRAHGYIEFDFAGYSIDPDTGIAEVRVHRIGETKGAVSVDYNTANGTLTATSDYVATSGTLSWADGEGGVKTFTVELQPGVLPTLQKKDYFQVQLSNHTGGAVAGITNYIDGIGGGIMQGDQQTARVVYHPRKVSQLFTDWQNDPVNSILPDYSHAGFGNGTMHPPVVPNGTLPVFHVDDYGATPDDNSDDDRESIQLAIDAAQQAGGGIVQFGAGTYLINTRWKIDSKADDSWGLWVRSSNIILRGAGKDWENGGTRLYSPTNFTRDVGPFAGISMVNFVPKYVKGSDTRFGHRTHGLYLHDYYNLDSSNGPKWEYNRENYTSPELTKYSGVLLANATQDITRNTRDVEVDNPQNFHPGQLVLVYQRSADAMGEFLYPHTNQDDYILQSPAYPYANLIVEAKTVDSVNGSTVTFKEPFKWYYKTQWGIDIVPYLHISNNAVEDMAFHIEYWHRSKGGDVNGSGISMTNVHNGWVRNVRFHDTNPMSFNYSKNCTAYNVVHTGNTQHNGFKFLSSQDCLMEKALSDIPNNDHDLAVQRHAVGNVYLDCTVSDYGAELDIHAQLPFANLYDRLKGGTMDDSMGGNANTKPNGGPLMTFWNWLGADRAGKSPLFGSERQYRYYDGATFANRFNRPIFAGVRHIDGGVAIQNVPTGSEDYYVDPADRVVAEAIDMDIYPSSLSMAQLEERTGLTARLDGVLPIIDGPVRVTAGEQVTYNGSAVGPAVGSLKWMDGGTLLGTGPSYTTSFATPGWHTIELVATNAVGIEVRTPREIYVFPADGQIMPDLAASTTWPWSTYLIEDGVPWQLVPLTEGNPIADPSQPDDATNPYIEDWTDGIWGFKTHQVGETYTYGGRITTELDSDGIDLTQADYEILFAESPLNIKDPRNAYWRIIARDINGNWAAFSAAFNQHDFTYTGSFTSGSWGAIAARYNLPFYGTFDPTQVTAIGVATDITRNFMANALVYYLGTFEITLPQADPTVNASASGVAGEWSGTQGTFTLTRGGDTSASLPVTVSFGGTGITAGDYSLAPAVTTTVTIPASSASTDVTVSALPDGLSEGDETLTMTIQPGAGYQIGTASAGVLLEDNPTDDWRYAFMGGNVPDSGDLEDFDGDNILNIFERGFGLDPTAKNTDRVELMPWVVEESGTFYLRWRQLANPEDITYEIQTAGQNGSFSTLAATPTLHEADVDGDGKVDVYQVELPAGGTVLARIRVLR